MRVVSDSRMYRHAALLCCLALALPAAVICQSREDRKYPTYDGSRHNAKQPNWGRSDTPFIHKQIPDKAFRDANNGSDTLTGANRPSPRAITLALFNKPYFKGTSEMNSSMLASGLGQLISQDINRGGSGPTGNGGPAPIKVPPGDYYMWRFADEKPVLQGSRTTLPYFRSDFKRASPGGRRQQVNEATAWLDASCIYGETAERSNLLRAGTAGRLLLDERKLLPFNKQPDTGRPKYIMRNPAESIPQTQLRLSGNANVNQNPLMMSMTNVFVREHNRRAQKIEAAHPDWSDDQIYQEARKWVIGHFQRIALVDYMSAIGLALPPYKGYNESLDPSIDTFFTVVSYRYGHATISDVVLRLDESWSEHPKGHMLMADSFYNPNVAFEAGLEALVRGMIAQRKGKVEPRWSLAMAGNFNGPSNVNGTDIAAINIQRGRDHGVPDYNTCRRMFGLPAAKSFSDITPDKDVAATLEQLYGDVNNIDPYVGGLAEPPKGSAHVGPLFAASISEQFARLRDADWWYFENGANNKLYNETEINEIRGTSLRDILARTTTIQDLPEDIWSATGSTTCAAGGASSLQGANTASGRNKLLLPALLAGTMTLAVEPASDAGWVKVSVTTTGVGWLGFGVADPDSPTPMIGADMVVGHMDGGNPTVKRYHAVDHQPPTELPTDSKNTRLRNAKFEQSGGKVSLEFERPTAGSSDDDRAMPVNSPLRLIVARGSSNDITSFSGYHGTPNREIINLQQGLFGTASTAAADPKAITRRRAHGVLMAVNFIVIFPLGAIAARQLRSHWLTNPRLRASMFYVHIFTQITGVACATAGFVIATRWFNVPYDQVMYSHGRMGIAILVMVYSQLLLGFVRPTATASSRRRHVWDVLHSLLGRAAMLIGLANVGLGLTIFCFVYGGNFSVWAGLCATGLGALSLLQYTLDRQEKYAVLRRDREQLLKEAGGSDDGGDKGGVVGELPSQQLDGSWQATPQNSGDAAKLSGEHAVEPTPDAAATADRGRFASPGYAYDSSGYGAPQHGFVSSTGAPAASPAANGGASGGRSPKLTSTLLQRHEASAGGQPPGNIGVSHPDFAPNGMQPGDTARASWDQAGMMQPGQQQQWLPMGHRGLG